METHNAIITNVFEVSPASFETYWIFYSSFKTFLFFLQNWISLSVHSRRTTSNLFNKMYAKITIGQLLL